MKDVEHDGQSEAVEIIAPDAEPRFIITCDHAANTIPPEYANLGMSADDLARHIAFDVGARGVTHELSRLLEAPAVCGIFSRLLIDPNRGEDDPTLIMRLSDRSIVPGNARVDAAERERRLDRFYRPYHRAIAALLDDAAPAMAARRRKPILVAMHSFTPRMRGGALRPWQIGVLCGRDDATPKRFFEILKAAHPELTIGENEPYTGHLEGDSMWRHGGDRDLPHVLIELRNDLIEDAAGHARWAALLAPALLQLEVELFDRGDANLAHIGGARALGAEQTSA